jgi:glycosyltransferase involved in cell wall biosynthesis
MKKRLLITTQKLDTGDPVLHFFLDWVREFARHYEVVYVICLYAGRYELPENVVVLSLGKESGVSRVKYLFRFYRAVIPLLVYRRIDQIFVHMNEIYVLLMVPLWPLRRLRGIPMAWWKTQAKINRLTRLLPATVDRLYTASPDGFKSATTKKRVVGHGINTTAFQPGERAPRTGPITIAAIGRVIPVKHAEDIVAAFAAAGLSAAEARLIFIGLRPEDRETDYVQALFQQVGQAGLTDQVQFLPPVPFSDMPRQYQEIDVLINMTYPYTFDKVLLEAMASGTLVVTPTPTYEPMLSPYGLFPQAPTAEAIGAVLRHSAQLSPAERLAIGAHLREQVVTHHNVERLIARISSEDWEESV